MNEKEQIINEPKYLTIKSGCDLNFDTSDIVNCSNIIELVNYKNIHELFILKLEIKHLYYLKNDIEVKYSFLLYVKIQICLLNQIESRIHFIKYPITTPKKQTNKLSTKKQTKQVERQIIHIKKQEIEQKHMYQKLKSLLSEDELKEFYKERDLLQEAIRLEYNL